MTPAQYAKHRGVSRQYIHKLIKAGKLTMLDGEIDPALADAELEMARAQSSHGPKGTAASSKVMNDYRRAVTRCANARAEALETANRTKASKLISEEKVEQREMRALRTLYDRLQLLAPTLTARYDGPRNRALYQWDISEDVNEALHDCSFLIQGLDPPPYERRNPVPHPPLSGAPESLTYTAQGEPVDLTLGQENEWLTSIRNGWVVVREFYDAQGNPTGPPDPNRDIGWVEFRNSRPDLLPGVELIRRWVGPSRASHPREIFQNGVWRTTEKGGSHEIQ